MTAAEAKEVVERLDPEYAEKIARGRLLPDVEEAVWIGAAELLLAQDEH